LVNRWNAIPADRQLPPGQRVVKLMFDTWPKREIGQLAAVALEQLSSDARREFNRLASEYTARALLTGRLPSYLNTDAPPHIREELADAGLVETKRSRSKDGALTEGVGFTNRGLAAARLLSATGVVPDWYQPEPASPTQSGSAEDEPGASEP
jgi:hypothetical protein